MLARRFLPGVLNLPLLPCLTFGLLAGSPCPATVPVGHVVGRDNARDAAGRRERRGLGLSLGQLRGQGTRGTKNPTR